MPRGQQQQRRRFSQKLKENERPGLQERQVRRGERGQTLMQLSILVVSVPHPSGSFKMWGFLGLQGPPFSPLLMSQSPILRVASIPWPCRGRHVSRSVVRCVPDKTTPSATCGHSRYNTVLLCVSLVWLWGTPWVLARTYSLFWAPLFRPIVYSQLSSNAEYITMTMRCLHSAEYLCLKRRAFVFTS